MQWIYSAHLQVFDFTLDPEEMSQVTALHRGWRYIVPTITVSHNIALNFTVVTSEVNLMLNLLRLRLPNHMQSNTMYVFASFFNWVLLCLFIFCRSMASLYPGMQDILTTLLMTPINAHFCKILCLETNVHSLLCVLINTIKHFFTYRNVC